MKGPLYDEGTQYEISSADDVPEAASRSYQQRMPLRDQEVSGQRTFGKVRPYWVVKAVARIEVLEVKIKEWKACYEEKLKVASVVSKGYFARFSFLLIVGGDGAVLGPVVANAIETGESDIYRFIVGAVVSCIIAGGSWAIACVVPFLFPRLGRPIAILVSGVLGGVTGYFIGTAGDGTDAGKILRSILTSSSLMAVVGLHFAIEASRHAWGPVKVAQRFINQMEKEMKKLIDKVAPYQEKAVDGLQNHNVSEVTRHEGLITGRHAYEKQGVRVSWLPQRFKNWLENILGAVVVATSLSLLPSYAFAGNKEIVLDVTGSIPNVPALADRLAKEVKFDFGDTVSAYIIDARGLTHVFSGEIRRVSQPGHRASREKVKTEMVAALKEAAKNADGGGSPIVSSLLTLATDLRVRSDKGEGLAVIVASDFASTDKAVIKGQPFSGMNVIAVLPPADGHSPTKRAAAIELAQKIFAGAKLHFAQ